VSDTEESAARNRLRDLTAQRRIVENQLLLAQNVIIDPGEIIASPLVPRSPSSPNHTLDLALGALIGLGLGFGMAYVRDRGDSGFKSAAALEDSLGVPVLAVIPSYRDEPSPRRDPVSLYRSNGPISEAYRTLRTAVLARATRSRLVTIAVTSSISGEGKSTTTSMLAIALANSGKRVILICGDLRRPSADRYLSVAPRPGLTDVLAGRLGSVRDVMQESAIPNLLVVPSGWTAADRDPSELLGSDRMRTVLEDCGSVDFVLIDLPATLAVTDALVLAPLADGVLFVASARGTSPQMIEFAKVQLVRMGANIVGGVLIGLRRPIGLDPSYYLRPESLPSSTLGAVTTKPRRDRIREGVATLLRRSAQPR
jgi:capsular exopolysaccharide synthesis family protein